MRKRRPVVFVCSPLTRATAAEDGAYARAAVRDSLLRGESPVCPHLLYPAVLDDSTEHRQLGMVAGAALIERCEIFALYVDRGIGRGMRQLLDQAKGCGLTIERRRVGSWVSVTDDAASPEPEPEPMVLVVRKNTAELG